MTDRSVARLRPFAGRYSPPFVDILYDYLLAINWVKYSSDSFDSFAEKTYSQLEKRSDDMPVVLRERLPKMLAGRFLHGYTNREGLDWVLRKFSLRLTADFDPGALSECFFQEIDHFSEDFNAFFPDLINKVKESK